MNFVSCYDLGIVGISSGMGQYSRLCHIILLVLSVSIPSAMWRLPLKKGCGVVSIVQCPWLFLRNCETREYEVSRQVKCLIPSFAAFYHVLMLGKPSIQQPTKDRVFPLSIMFYRFSASLIVCHAMYIAQQASDVLVSGTLPQKEEIYMSLSWSLSIFQREVMVEGHPIHLTNGNYATK